MRLLLVCLLMSTYLVGGDIYIDDREYLKTQEFTTRWSGYIRNDVFANTRQVVAFSQGIIPTVPLPPLPDPLGCDINAVGDFGITPLRSFLRLDAWGIKCGSLHLNTGYQFNFLGINDLTAGNINLWHAYGQLIGNRDRFIFGLYRHPFGILRVYPRSFLFNIASIAVAPQLRWWHNWGDFQLMFAAYGQLINADYGQSREGLIVASPEFIQNSGKPGISCRFQSANPLYLIGIGADYYQLLPRLQTAKGFATSQTVSIWNGTFYAALDAPDIWIKLQALAGQDFALSTLLGGYALAACNADTNICQYAPIPSATIRLDMEWRRHPIVHPGLFIGWATTWRASQRLFISPTTQQPVFFGAIPQLHEIARVAVRCEIDFEPVRFGLEWDFTRAVWGPLNTCGTTNQPTPIGVGRLLFVSWCDF